MSDLLAAWAWATIWASPSTRAMVYVPRPANRSTSTAYDFTTCAAGTGLGDASIPPASPPRSLGLAEASADIVEGETCAWLDGAGIDALGPDEHATAPSTARAIGRLTSRTTLGTQPSYVANPTPAPGSPEDRRRPSGALAPGIYTQPARRTCESALALDPPLGQVHAEIDGVAEQAGAQAGDTQGGQPSVHPE